MRDVLQVILGLVHNPMKALEKQQAVALRNQGLSYREIQEVVRVSRGSLGRWLRGIELGQAQQQRIHHKNLSIRRKFVEYNERKRVQTQAQKLATLQQCSQDIGNITIRELHLVGAALYWAEGSKGNLTSVVEFVNADPAMIALMMRWFRMCCQVPEQKFRARVQLHDTAQQLEAERFWSTLTGIPAEQFTRPMLKLSPSSQRKRGNSLPYGTIHIRIADVQLLTKIRGWMKGLTLAPSSSPA